MQYASSVPPEHHQERIVKTCPVCDGPVVPLDGSCRCTRCHFSLCEGCEGGTDRAWPLGDVSEE